MTISSATLSSKFRLLAIDVDGTLVAEREEISDENHRALVAAKDHCMVSLCTGRSPDEVVWIIEQLGLQDNFHILGGGTLLRKPGGEIQHLAILDDQVVAAVEERMKDYHLAYLTAGNWSFGLKTQSGPFGSMAVLAAGKEMATQVERELRAVVGNNFVTSITHFENVWVQVTPPECHKGSGLKYLMHQLNLKPEQVLGVGDMYNDIPMFDVLPWSVAMGNAPDDVKAKASFVTTNSHHDGVAHAIWNYFFESTKLL